MSSNKIIFLSIAGTIVIWILIAFWALNRNSATKNAAQKWSLTVWIVGDTTEWYDTLTAGFHEYAPEYKNVSITFKKFSDYSSYQKILLSTLADQKWPDIFMVDADADNILRDKVDPIPSEYINISDFAKRFDDVFLPLLESSGSSKSAITYLRGVPLWYETLGIFYNKSLLVNIPKTWNDVSNMYTDGTSPEVFPVNIWLGPRYTPYTTDILGLFLLQDGSKSYKEIGSHEKSITNYLSYWHSAITGKQEWTPDGTIENTTLSDMETSLSEDKLTTIDLFIRGKIAFVIGYPTMIKDIEDAKKRAGSEAINAIILTEKIPQKSLAGDMKNIAKYRYLWLSKTSQNSLLWAKFLDYLLTEDAEKRFLEAFPLYIPAQRSFYESSQNTTLSNIFSRAKLDSFIPSAGETLQTFEYGNKMEFEQILWDNIDRNGKIDTNNIMNLFQTSIWCESETENCVR